MRRSGFVVAVVCLFGSLASAAQHNLTGGVITNGKARFTVIAKELIRLEYDDSSHFIDAPSLFAVNRDARFTDFKSENTSTETLIDTGRVKLIYTPDGKPFSATNLKIFVQKDDGEVVLWTPAKKNKENLGGTRNSLDNIDGTVPVGDGVLARDGWSVIDDSNRFILTMQNGHQWVDQRPTPHETDLYFFGYGDDYRAALKAFTKIGGDVPLPRKYVFGSWYSRWWPYTSQDYRDIVKEFHDHDFPIDNLVLDMDWHKKDSWTGYSWNSKLFPDAPQFLQWLHERGLHVTLNDHPQGGVGPYEERYNEFMTDMGFDASKKATIPYDAGDQKYINTLFKHMHEPLEKMGVDFWWLDWMGDTDFVFNRIDWVNEYYYKHSRHDGLRGEGFFRWADFGDHRHPIHFSGDTHSSWQTLAFEVPFTAESGNSGVFFWTHDMGGFEGPRNGELLARWVQFGAFSAALRLHSINHRNFDKRPWTYSKEVEDSMRVSFHLRSVFFPYTYSSAYESHVESVPLVRPLYFDDTVDEEAYQNPQEYMYGDSVLVAPIVSKGGFFSHKASQTVWFPKGEWYDWFTGARVDGPAKEVVTDDLNSFPLFIKGGRPIFLQPYNERMATAPLKVLTVRVYEGEDGQNEKAKLYEDDGVSEDYLHGHYGLTNVSYARQNSMHTIRINAETGQFAGQVTDREYFVELAGAKPARSVTVNGQAVSVTYDAVNEVNRIFIPQADIHTAFEIVFDAD
jgi:alpha-glucosidase (family GH31 glycosyl hydrolase)